MRQHTEEIRIQCIQTITIGVRIEGKYTVIIWGVVRKVTAKLLVRISQKIPKP